MSDTKDIGERYRAFIEAIKGVMYAHRVSRMEPMSDVYMDAAFLHIEFAPIKTGDVLIHEGGIDEGTREITLEDVGVAPPPSSPGQCSKSSAAEPSSGLSAHVPNAEEERFQARLAALMVFNPFVEPDEELGHIYRIGPAITNDMALRDADDDHIAQCMAIFQAEVAERAKGVRPEPAAAKPTDSAAVPNAKSTLAPARGADGVRASGGPEDGHDAVAEDFARHSAHVNTLAKVLCAPVLGYFTRGGIKWNLISIDGSSLRGFDIKPGGGVDTLHISSTEVDELVLATPYGS